MSAVSCQGTSADDTKLAAGEGAARGSTLAPSLEATFASPGDLARTVVAAVAREDQDALKRLPLSKEEFRWFAWPELPSSRPERGVPFEFVWSDLSQKSMASVARNYARYKGKHLEFLDVRFDGETTDYGAFKVHRDARVLVRLDDGREVWLDLFGSVMERDGRYKLFSYVTD